MEKITGMIFGILCYLFVTIPFYELISNNIEQDDLIWRIIFSLIFFIIGSLSIWFGYNCKLIAKRIESKLRAEINSIKGISNDKTIINNLEIRILYNIQHFSRSPSFLLLCFKLNQNFTEKEKRSLSIEFDNQIIDKEKYLIFRKNVGLFMNSTIFKKFMNKRIEQVEKKILSIRNDLKY